MWKNLVVGSVLVSGTAMGHTGFARWSPQVSPLMHISQPAPKDLGQYLRDNEHQAKMIPVRGQMAKTLTVAMQNRGAFTRITLMPPGADTGSVAYVPQGKIKGLPANTAFISRSTIAGEFWYRLELPQE